MRIKLDENIPARLLEALRNLGHDVDSALTEGLKGKDDDVIWGAVAKEGRFLITQDLDFSDLRKYRPGTHGGILLVRLRQPGRLALATRILEVFRRDDCAELAGCFVVLTERKIRIRRPRSES